MPRSNRPKRRTKPTEEPAEIDFSRSLVGVARVETKRGNDYQVQTVTGSKAEEGKSWVCPECLLIIQQGTAHIVAWDVHRGVSGRRHFHNHCWKIFQGPLL